MFTSISCTSTLYKLIINETCITLCGTQKSVHKRNYGAHIIFYKDVFSLRRIFYLFFWFYGFCIQFCCTLYRCFFSWLLSNNTCYIFLFIHHDTMILYYYGSYAFLKRLEYTLTEKMK